MIPTQPAIRFVVLCSVLLAAVTIAFADEPQWKRELRLAARSAKEAAAHFDGGPVDHSEDRIPVCGRLRQGAVQGAYSGFSVGFAAVEMPAVALIEADMERGLGMVAPGVRFYAGVLLGAILYIPALVVGLAGGVLGTPAGAAAEAVEQGSTKRWFTL